MLGSSRSVGLRAQAFGVLERGVGHVFLNSHVSTILFHSLLCPLIQSEQAGLRTITEPVGISNSQQTVEAILTSRRKSQTSLPPLMQSCNANVAASCRRRNEQYEPTALTPDSYASNAVFRILGSCRRAAKQQPKRLGIEVSCRSLQSRVEEAIMYVKRSIQRNLG